MKWPLLFLALVSGCVLGFFIPRGGPVDAPEVGDGGGSEDKSAAGQAQSGGVGSAGGALAVELPGGDTIESLKTKDATDQFDYFHAWISAAEVGEYPAIMDALYDTGGRLSGQVRQILIALWAEADPEAMFAYVQGGPESRQRGLTWSFFSAWGQADPEAAYAAALRMPEAQRDRSVQAILYAIAEERPRLAISMADANPQFLRRQSHVYGTIFRRWAERDPEAARRAALEMEHPQLRRVALDGALGAWMQDAPEEALAWIDAQPLDRTMRNAKRSALGNLMRNDLESVQSYVESRSSSLEQREIIEGLYFQNAPWSEDFEVVEGLFDWLDTVATGQVYDRKVGEVIRAMADADPDQAIDFVHSLRPGSARLNALGQLAGELAETSAEAAFAFVDSLQYEDERNRALGAMAWRLARNDLEGTAAIISASTDTAVQQRLATAVAREWAEVDQSAALAWAETLSDDTARDQARREVVQRWLMADPGAALGYLAELSETTDTQTYYTNGFNQWAREDPAEAAAWLERIPGADATRKAQLYSSVARNYAHHDPMAASEWIAGLESGEARDFAVQALTSHIVRSDPEAAFIWSDSMDSGQQRERGLEQSVREWIKVDPSAARRAVAGTQMPEETRSKLLEMIAQQDG